MGLMTLFPNNMHEPLNTIAKKSAFLTFLILKLDKSSFYKIFNAIGNYINFNATFSYGKHIAYINSKITP